MDIKDVENLALLARLELADEEKILMLKDLEGVLAYVKTIKEADVGDMKTEYELYNVWREDSLVNVPNFSREIIIEQFPDSQDGFLKVKKIL